MTSLLPTLFVLLTATPEPETAAQPTQERTIEIVITGPERIRGQMEETIRALIGNEPDVHWTTREILPGDGSLPATRPESGDCIWIDVAHPVEVRVYLPGRTSNGARNLRTVERSEGEEAGLVERETVAQIVKAALQSLRSDAAPAPPTDTISKESVKVAPAANLARRPAGTVWIGMGGGAGWGYVPEGKLEWEQHVRVAAQAERAGMFHLLPEVGYMWSDDFALAAQARVEFIRQEQATYKDPNTGQTLELAANLTGTPKSMAYAGLVRAIWYHDLSQSGRLRFSLSGDVGGGFIRFPVKPVAVVTFDPDGNPITNYNRTIAKTDTRPVGMFLFGGSAGLLWHLSRHFAFAFDGRVLSGLPSPGFVLEGQVSVQLALGGTRRPLAGAEAEAP